MNLEQLLDTGGSQISVTVSAKDLKQFADDLIAQTRTKILMADRDIEPLLTLTEVAEKLRVDRSTLYRWNESGYLKVLEVGGQRRYRSSDVMAIINQRVTK